MKQFIKTISVDDGILEIVPSKISAFHTYLSGDGIRHFGVIVDGICYLVSSKGELDRIKQLVLETC